MEQNTLFEKANSSHLAEPFAKTFEVRCPYLGLKDDRATALGFPNDGNHCYRHDQAVPMTQEWQADYCLTCNFETCSIFQQEELPEQPSRKIPIWLSWPRPLAVILPLTLIVIAAFLWWPAPGKSIQESTSNAAPLHEVVVTEEAVQRPVSEKIVATKNVDQPTTSQKIVVTKERDHSTTSDPAVAIDAANLETAPPVPPTPVPTAEPSIVADQPIEESGGFRVTTYD